MRVVIANTLRTELNVGLRIRDFCNVKNLFAFSLMDP
jgi:hypothetical protein